MHSRGTGDRVATTTGKDENPVSGYPTGLEDDVTPTLREAAENILAVTNWEAFHKAREVLRAALAADAPEPIEVTDKMVDAAIEECMRHGVGTRAEMQKVLEAALRV